MLHQTRRDKGAHQRLHGCRSLTHPFGEHRTTHRPTRRHDIEQPPHELGKAVADARRYGQVAGELTDRADLLADLGRIGDQDGLFTVRPQQTVAAHAQCAGDGSGNSHDHPPQPPGVPGGVQSTASMTRLDQNRAPGQRGDDPVTGQEAPPVGRAARWRLAQDQPVVADTRQQLRVGTRIGDVDAAGKDRNRGPTGRERATVGSRIDAEGRPGDHRPAPVRQPRGKIGGDGRSIGRGRARPHDRHGPLAQLVEVPGAVHPQRERFARFGVRIGPGHIAKYAQRGRPLQVTRAEQSPAECGQQAKVALRVDIGMAHA